MAVGIMVMLELIETRKRHELMHAYVPKYTLASLIPKGRFCKPVENWYRLNSVRVLTAEKNWNKNLLACMHQARRKLVG